MNGWLPFIEFPKWLIKFGLRKKSKRLIREFKALSGVCLNAGKTAVQNEYVPLLYQIVMSCLEEREGNQYLAIREAS